MCLARRGLRSAEVDANRERPHQRDAVAPLYGKSLPLDARLERGIDCLEEIVAVRLGMETDQVRAKQAVEELPLPRANAERFRIGPRNMPEDGDARVGTRLFD